MRQHGRFGVFNLKTGRIKNSYFKEKPQGDGDDTAWINGGFFVLEPEVFDYIEGDYTVFEKEPLGKPGNDGQLSAFKHTVSGSPWIPSGTKTCWKDCGRREKLPGKYGKINYNTHKI